MAAPWREPGPYQPYPHRPHSPSAPARVHPYAAVGPQRHSFYSSSIQAAPIPGFYNPAIPQQHPATPPQSGGPPAFPQPRVGLPPSLVPGRQSSYELSRRQSNDYFFQNDAPLYHVPPRHARTDPVPQLPRKPDFDQPPLPPKPDLSPQPHSFPAYPPKEPLYASPEPSPAPYTSPQALAEQQEDAVLNRILELSMQESRRPSHGEPSEEDQLARALEESLKMTPSPRGQSPDRDRKYSNYSASPEQGPSALPATSSNRRSWVGGSRASGGTHRTEQISADEALARQLAEEEERMLREEEEQARQDSRAQSPPQSQPRPQSQSQGQSQLSPQLQLQSQPQSPSPSPGHAPGSSVVADPLPQYDEAVSSPPAASSAFYNSSFTAHLAPDAGPSKSGSLTHIPSLGRSVSEKPVSPKVSTPPDVSRPLGRSHSLGQGVPPAANKEAPSPTRDYNDEKKAASPTSASAAAATGASASGSGAEIMSNTQYLDAELLAGLSMNFGTPPISPSLTPFAGVIPNVIALPYGRTLPFFIKAPSWRNLLKLMARLSGTRLEPTMEAMAVIKTEMKLRVVISFVKVHQMSNDWHTVLYMTIDHPVPPNAPTGWKYRNGDTSTLPWSYTLSQLPAFLRDGADAPLSRFYTVPETQELPFPVLPISFPTLATYLASALETSRDAMHDSSSGVRRLAKCVDQFYPSDRPAGDDEPERGGMRRRLKNLVGMGSRPQRDRNADVYELVTPFMADEYGH